VSRWRRTWIVLRISSSRPKTGSSLPARACAVRSVPYFTSDSPLGVFSGLVQIEPSCWLPPLPLPLPLPLLPDGGGCCLPAVLRYLGHGNCATAGRRAATRPVVGVRVRSALATGAARNRARHSMTARPDALANHHESQSPAGSELTTAPRKILSYLITLPR
jgi:hypothetical protein